MRREGSLAHLLARVEGALVYVLEQMERRTEGSTWLNRKEYALETKRPPGGL
jgi:hypothetical protein